MIPDDRARAAFMAGVRWHVGRPLASEESAARAADEYIASHAALAPSAGTARTVEGVEGERPLEVRLLADAMWQLLDDMGADGKCVCGLAKAQARIAYEPFADDPEFNENLMPLGAAQAIVDEVNAGYVRALAGDAGGRDPAGGAVHEHAASQSEATPDPIRAALTETMRRVDASPQMAFLRDAMGCQNGTDAVGARAEPIRAPFVDPHEPAPPNIATVHARADLNERIATVVSDAMRNADPAERLDQAIAKAVLPFIDTLQGERDEARIERDNARRTLKAASKLLVWREEKQREAEALLAALLKAKLAEDEAHV